MGCEGVEYCEWSEFVESFYVGCVVGGGLGVVGFCEIGFDYMNLD